MSILNGINNLPKVHLETSKSSCEVYLHGAHITSYKVDGVEQLFLSEKSAFEDNKAIRGGVPIIFPQFGPGKIQTHGFARNIDWKVVSTSRNEDVSKVVLSCTDNEHTKKIWNYSFSAQYAIELHTDRLSITFSTTNCSTEPFDFQLALHTYFQISNIDSVYVEGLEGLEFIDKMKNASLHKETRQQVTIGEEVDRVYKNAENNVILVDNRGASPKKTILIHDSLLPDVVVWNPWIAKSKSMADFGDEEYKKMICIELGLIDKPYLLQPSKTFTTTHTIYPSPSSKSSPNL
eukprot:gene2065-2546_t